jgi:hypothetical protein
MRTVMEMEIIDLLMGTMMVTIISVLIMEIIMVTTTAT